MQASLVPLSKFYSLISLLAPLLAAIFLEGLGAESDLYILIHVLVGTEAQSMCFMQNKKYPVSVKGIWGFFIKKKERGK